VYWATGQTVADIIGTVFEQNLPRSEVGTYQFYRANLPAAMPLATYALLVIDPPTPGNPNGSVLEAREDNNVYPFPIVPIAPTVQIVIARAASSTTASGAAVDAEGDPLFRKEFYKAWVRVANNSNQSMGISGDWTESLPTSPPIEPPTQHGTFSDTAIDGGCVTFLPLKDATSGDLFRRTWDWVPPTEPFTLSKAQHEMEAQLVKELAVIGLENLLKNAEGLHVAVSLATLVKHVVDKSQAMDQAIPQVELDVVAGMKWWPSVSPASFELTQSRATLVFEVPDEQQNAYRQYWTDRLLGDVYEGYAFIDMLLQPWVFWKTAIELKQAASHQYALAVDPPDTNFTQTAIAVTNYPAEIASMPEGPTKKLAINVFDLGSVTEAKITALNRAQGAEAVGAFDWQARQLESAAGHARASAMLQISALLLTKQLDPEIQRTVANNEQSLVPSLQQNGLPANIVTNLMQLGWTAAQIEEYRTNLIDIGTSLLDQPGLNQLSYVLGVCLASDDASRLLSTAAAIRRDMLGIPPTAITTEQRQQLSSGQAQLEIALASGTNLDAILAILNTYATNLDQITEQSANLESLQSEAGFGDLALGSVLAQVVDPADYVSLSVQYASNCVVLSWPALSSLALERSTSLTQPQWQAANLTPTNQWGEYLVSLPPTNGAAFFRLRKVVPSPVIQAELSAFSTNAFGIAVVSKPVVSGTIANGTNISWMLGGFVTNGSVIFSDLSSSLSPYFKRFSIGRSELEQVNGGPLLDGTYTFRLKALDLQSNVVSSSDFTFQLDTHAPTLYLSNSVADVDTNTPGIQTVEYSTLRFRSGIFDDGGVSKLELLMNSNVLVTGTFFPWEDFLVQAPAYVAGSNLFRIQTRGTDLAGNTALSAPVDIEVVPDGTNPTVASVSPLDGMTLTNLNVDHVTVSFSKPISPGSLNPTNFILLEAGPNGLFGDGDDVVHPRSTCLEL
jgi:hypothetical protein